MGQKQIKIMESTSITREILVECFSCVFTLGHSDGFKAAEMRDLLYAEDYHFLTLPKQDWKVSLKAKLEAYGINTASIKMLQ